ncbi:hypothetical protein IW261DRAFT_1570725 [Armillaria novae-zelandiae]|uniref:Uncharacterized protein n=1 Tax=Armillaria novae-zelandiae TaxID=153914 RepID=A0AA39UBI6_9AGAR|nr:hypothetical protein IW261DRAFT_1570725 [Armillaria novae-zelandiae]
MFRQGLPILLGEVNAPFTLGKINSAEIAQLCIATSPRTGTAASYGADGNASTLSLPRYSLFLESTEFFITATLEWKDNTHTLRKRSGVPVKWIWAKHAHLLHKLELVLELEWRPACAKCARWSPWVRSTVRQMLKIAYHSPPKLLEANTEFEFKEMAEPAASPKASGASPPTGGTSSSDKEGEEEIEWDAQASVSEEELIRSSGSEMPLAGQKHIALASPIPLVAAGEHAREPPLKKAKGFIKTGWLLMLNQWLREGWMQPAMCANMEAMQDEGLLLVGTSVLFFCVVQPPFQAASTKCDHCKAASSHSCRIPVDSDNGRPSCAECLISSHSCPSCFAPATQVACLPTIHKAPTACRQVVVTVPHIGEVAHEYQRIEGSQMNLHLPVGGDSTTDFTFGLVERLTL